MNCDEFEELAGAYAIGALTEEERVMAEEHLASCDKHPELARLQGVARSLAFAAPEMDPPATLKARLMDAIRAEAGPAPAAQPAPPARRRGLAEVISGWFSNPRTGYALAGVMSVLVAALVVWNVSLQGEESNQLVVQLSGEATGQLIYLKDQQLAVMELQGLDDLPAGKVYEAWAITGTVASPIGTFTSSGGQASTALAFDRSAVDVVGITIEDAPGAQAPSMAPIITGEF
jgi:anti-sigma-K factor RskA